MLTAFNQALDARLRNLREDFRGADADALLATHPPSVRYLTGLAATAGAVVVTSDRCILLADFRYRTVAEALVARRAPGSLELVVPPASYDAAIVEVIRGAGVRRIAVEGASLPVGRFGALGAALGRSGDPDAPAPGDVRLVVTEGLVEGRRAIKDPPEVATLREAGQRISRVARQLRSFVREGRSERMIAGDIEAALRAEGFERPAFDTIVASGPNGAHPHARAGERTLRPGDGVVLDFGGVYDGYCVDLTRTLFLGAPAPALARMAAAVHAAHAAALAEVRPGARPSRIDAAARDLLASRGLGEAFGHATGHGLGLEVHEAPRIAKASAHLADTPVAAGMVFTIEPGAYVEGLGGVRIEDDVLVVEGGCELLTDVPIEL